MRIEYVLLSKKTIETKLDSKEIKSILKSCFSDVTSNTFLVKPLKADYSVSYSISYSSYQHNDSSEKVYSVIFEIDCSRKDRTAEILDFTHRRFSDCSKLSEHHLIIAFDEVSEYYCNKCYPKIQRFERLVRQLIYIIMTKAYGALWVEKTINNEIKDELKKKISLYYPDIKDKALRDEKIIEEALQQMDIFHLEKFLFDESRDIEPSEIVDIKLTKDAIVNMSKEDIIAIIDDGRLKSLWDRFFAKDIPIENPKIKISLLRDGRNKVAHCKPFYFKDYKEVTKLLDELTSSIEKAISDIEMIKYEPGTLSDVLAGFANALVHSVNWIDVNKTIAPMLSMFADVSLSFSKVIDNSMSTVISGFSEFSKQLTSSVIRIPPILPELSSEFRVFEQINSLLAVKEIMDQQQELSRSLNANINYSAIINNPTVEAIGQQSKLIERVQPNLPILEALQREYEVSNQVLDSFKENDAEENQEDAVEEDDAQSL
jgi:hypothetical protein